MRIGLDHYTIAQRGLNPTEVLAFARERGLDGVQFLDAQAIDPALDPGRLDAFRRQADALGLYLEVGLPCPNPARQSRLLGHPVDPGDLAAELARSVEAAAVLGVHHARVFVGDRHDRFRTDVNWQAQQDATSDVLKRLAPALKNHKIRVAIETHADLTVDELLRMVDTLGDDVAGVTLDTGNLVMRLDEPVEAAERLAPLVLGTHVKDAVLAFSSRGLVWQARPVGAGILPLPEMLAPACRANPALNLSIELHPRTYDLPIFDQTWLAFFPALRPASLAAVVRLATLCERGYASGTLERPEEVEAIPWSERDVEWVARSVGYIRPVVELLGTI